VFRGLSVAVPATVTGAVLEVLGRAVDRAGLRGLWLYDGQDGAGRAGGEALTLAGAATQHTRKVTIGVVVDPAAGRPPAVVAKELTAVDRLSEGRAALVLGRPPGQAVAARPPGATTRAGLEGAAVGDTDVERYLAICQTVLYATADATGERMAPARRGAAGRPTSRVGAAGHAELRGPAVPAPNLPPPVQQPGPPVGLVEPASADLAGLAQVWGTAVVTDRLERVDELGGRGGPLRAVSPHPRLPVLWWQPVPVPDRWASFEDAIAAAQQRGAAGVVVDLGPRLGGGHTTHGPAGSRDSSRRTATEDPAGLVDLVELVGRFGRLVAGLWGRAG
jgi:hypothetical protein